jgi:hypothetical protein
MSLKLVLLVAAFTGIVAMLCGSLRVSRHPERYIA